MDPPFKPTKTDLSRFLKKTEPYESIFKDEKDSTVSPKKKKNKEEDENSDYDPNWIEVF